MSYDGTMRDSKSGRFSAGYDVPHVRFRRTQDGFTASWNKTSEYVFKLMHGLSNFSGNASANQPKEGNFFYVLFLLLLLGINVLMSGWWVIDRLLFGWRKIEVDPQYITVAKMRMTREHFGHFDIHHMLTNGRRNYAVLGYTFANRRHSFGGVWDVDKAEEVAGALNAHLRENPSAARTAGPNPDDLRRSRPSGF